MVREVRMPVFSDDYHQPRERYSTDDLDDVKYLVIVTKAERRERHKQRMRKTREEISNSRTEASAYRKPRRIGLKLL